MYYILLLLLTISSLLEAACNIPFINDSHEHVKIYDTATGNTAHLAPEESYLFSGMQKYKFGNPFVISLKHDSDIYTPRFIFAQKDCPLSFERQVYFSDIVQAASKNRRLRNPALIEYYDVYAVPVHAKSDTAYSAP